MAILPPYMHVCLLQFDLVGKVMCDFWLSPADQGDLSDVVRASLQHRPPVGTPGAAAAACCHASLGAGPHDPPEEEELFLLPHGANRSGDDNDEVHLQQQQQPIHGNGMGFLVSNSNNSSSSCDPLLLQSSTSYPQPEPLQTEGLIRHVMSGPPPQLLCAAAVVDGECDVAAPEMDEHGLNMAMDAHPHHAQAIKRRKSQTKKVVCIPAPTAAPPGVGGRSSTSGEVVPSDLWAWRKYGQKPIKGSPYPRGYYRCSSSKGCSARKQVERSRTDPSMLVITYTSDHNHPWPTQRNALAGSTRPAASSSSAAAKSHGPQQHHSMAAAVPQPPPRQHTVSIIGDSADMLSFIGNNGHHQLLPKQEDAAADHDLDMFADMDGALNVMTASSNFNPQKQKQQHATATDDDDHLEQDDRQQLFDPFSFSFFDWVGASVGVRDANNKGGFP